MMSQQEAEAHRGVALARLSLHLDRELAGAVDLPGTRELFR